MPTIARRLALLALVVLIAVPALPAAASTTAACGSRSNGSRAMWGRLAVSRVAR